MMVRLHKNATTTPATRRYIQSSNLPVRRLARELGVSEDTIRRWKKRTDVEDRPHTAHRLQTNLTPFQEAVVVELRRTLMLPLDDLLAVVREFITPNVSRSGLDRCLRRHGVGSLKALQPKAEKPGHKPFKSYEPGFVHLDVKYLPQMPDEDKRRYLFVAIDRATRWVFVAIYPEKTAANARRFLRSLIEAAPFRLHTILTDNGKEFTDRFITRGERTPTGAHAFDELCQALDIEHRLTKPRRPQTNGMVERFNGRISEVLATHRFDSREALEATIHRYVWLYNHHIPQKALGHVPPIEAMKRWYKEKPELFIKIPRNRPGPDTYPWPRSPRRRGPLARRLAGGGPSGRRCHSPPRRAMRRCRRLPERRG
jgi:transposase InsO family protein